MAYFKNTRRTRRPKPLTPTGLIYFGEYVDVVTNGGNNNTFFETGEVYKEINGVQTLISYSTNSERYLHLTLDLSDMQAGLGEGIIMPWFWHRGNKRFFGQTHLGNPDTTPSKTNPTDMERDYIMLTANSGEINSRTIDIHGADKVFFQMFLPGIDILAFQEAGTARLYATLNTF